jgi:hypothetical protein
MSWRRWRSVRGGRIVQTMGNRFDQTDFSVVVKKRAPPVGAANRAGKAALKQLLTEFPD